MTESRVALVTGGSRGLGRVMVTELVSAGHKVGFLARRSFELSQMAAELPDDVLALPADITDSAAVDAAVAALVERWGRLDVVVNNAAAFEPALLTNGDDDVVCRQVDVNLVGTVVHACGCSASQEGRRARGVRLERIGPTAVSDARCLYRDEGRRRDAGVDVAR